MNQLIRTSSAPAHLTSEQLELANVLYERHGTVTVSRESSGLHFHICCPDCLASDGEKELYSKHLAINVDKYMGGHNRAASCMKTGQVFSIDELTMWPPLEKRGFRRGPERVADQSVQALESCEPDSQGRWIPKGPGETVPLRTLPPDHPAILYLTSRNFSIADLEHQFAAVYCVKQRQDIKYRKLLGGFKASPQGRIVLFIYQHGVRQGWQARILEMADEHNLYYWQPYKEAWIAVKRRENPGSEWVLMDGWETWDSAKWIMAHGARRNQILMGYDAARAFNAATRPKRRFCFVCEGPLDAGRLGPPAVAVCGKVCSQGQAELLEQAFDTIIIVPDRDEAGSKLAGRVADWLQGRRQLIVIPPPGNRKDAGEMTPQEAKIFRTAAMVQAGLL